MTRTIDILCGSCDYLWEDTIVGDDYGKCPICNSGNINRVFTPNTVQFIATKASCVDHVMKHNAKIKAEQFEEDSSPGSAALKELEDVTEYGTSDVAQD